jgi:hypothetical protein
MTTSSNSITAIKPTITPSNNFILFSWFVNVHDHTFTNKTNKKSIRLLPNKRPDTIISMDGKGRWVEISTKAFVIKIKKLRRNPVNIN